MTIHFVLRVIVPLKLVSSPATIYLHGPIDTHPPTKGKEGGGLFRWGWVHRVGVDVSGEPDKRLSRQT